MLPSFTVERYTNLIYHNWFKQFFMKILEEAPIVDIEVEMVIGEGQGEGM
jgi:hypothetical protein